MGIRPWEINLMTYAEFERSCMAIDIYLEAQKPKK